MLRMVRAEVKKLLHTPGGAYGTLLWVALVALMYWQTWRGVVAEELETASLFPEFSLTYALSAMVVIGPLLTAVVGAVVIGQEFRYGTWPSLLTLGANRTRIYLAKVLAVVTVTVAWVLAGLVVALVLSSLITGRVVLPTLDGTVAGQFGVVLFNLLFWCLLSFAVAMWGRSTTAGVLAGFGLPWAEMMLHGVESLRRFTPVWNQRALNAAAFATVPDGMVQITAAPSSPTAGYALAVLTVEVVIILVWGLLAVRRPVR